MTIHLLSLVVLMAPALPTSPTVGTTAEFVVLSARHGAPPPVFNRVTLQIGPTEAFSDAPHVWWQLAVYESAAGGDEPLMVLQALTDRVPFAESNHPPSFARYILHVPATAETLEYRNTHTGRALLPPWTGFETHFVPRPARAGAAEGSAPPQVPHTCDYLGHVLSIRKVQTAAWRPLEHVKELKLDPELLVGTARNFKEKENGRLPNAKEQDYTWVPFTQQDYAVMLQAGTNLFSVTSDQLPFVSDEPVFYLRRPDPKTKPRKPICRYPADVYRSNFLGTEMFLDEPAIILTFDDQVKGKLQHVSDVISLVQARIRAEAGLTRSLERTLASDHNLGDLMLENPDVPSWETEYYTAFYQMQAGLAGFVHEGRYRLDGFDEKMGRWTGKPRKHTADEMLRYYYAFLRGGTRPFNKHWGTAIYGQADPAIAPRAVTLAYDMGARYIWFWTSDHEHHVPWAEQMQLTRALREHAAAHPRPSISGSPKQRDLAIVIPYGILPALDRLAWIAELRENTSPHAARQQRVLERAHRAIDEALAGGDDFDVTIDDGREITGYKRVLRIE